MAAVYLQQCATRTAIWSSVRIMDQKKRMDAVRKNFSERTSEYDSWIRKVVPRYEEMLDVLVSCIRMEMGDTIRAIDLGCGTGALSQKLLGSFPHADLTCLDMTEGMLDQARDRLKEHGSVRYVLSDLYDYKFDGPYDAVISCLALHHIVTDEDKLMIYRRIHDGLAPGGVFLNADIMLGADDALQELYINKWKEFMYTGLPREEVEGSLLPRHREEDSPARMTDHLRWLEQAGFRSIDSVWKYYGYAVYGGKK